MAQEVKIRVNEDPNWVEVEYLGETHRGEWDEDDIEAEEGSNGEILYAAMNAWDGNPEMTITDKDLEENGGGFWERPETTAARRERFPDLGKFLPKKEI